MGKSLIKKCFTSRFDQGSIVEMDFSQLEVVGLAVLSNDQNLKDDLKNKLDLHCVNTANLYGADYSSVYSAYRSNDAVWTARRKTTKQLSFQLQYGAGVNSMAQSTGVSKTEAQNFINVYYERYWRVKEWQEEVKTQVLNNAVNTNRRTKLGYPAKKSYYKLPTGRMFTFYEYDAPDFMKDKGQHTSFSPTEMKNYPVQGFSTGDFMMCAMQGVLNLMLRTDFFGGRILPISTIHDSFVFDVHKDTTIDELTQIKEVLKRTPYAMNLAYKNLDFDILVGVDVETGHDWHSMINI